MLVNILFLCVWHQSDTKMSSRIPCVGLGMFREASGLSIFLALVRWQLSFFSWGGVICPQITEQHTCIYIYIHLSIYVVSTASA